MAKVIETNISVNEQNEIIDFQSRVIEVISWESFIEEIKAEKSIVRRAAIGTMYGNTLPKESKIDNLICTEYNLMCDIYNYQGIKFKKLAYLI